MGRKKKNKGHEAATVEASDAQTGGEGASHLEFEKGLDDLVAEARARSVEAGSEENIEAEGAELEEHEKMAREIAMEHEAREAENEVYVDAVRADANTREATIYINMADGSRMRLQDLAPEFVDVKIKFGDRLHTDPITREITVPENFFLKDSRVVLAIREIVRASATRDLGWEKPIYDHMLALSETDNADNIKNLGLKKYEEAEKKATALFPAAEAAIDARVESLIAEIRDSHQTDLLDEETKKEVKKDLMKIREQMRNELIFGHDESGAEYLTGKKPSKGIVGLWKLSDETEEMHYIRAQRKLGRAPYTWKPFYAGARVANFAQYFVAGALYGVWHVASDIVKKVWHGGVREPLWNMQQSGWATFLEGVGFKKAADKARKVQPPWEKRK